MPKLILFNIMVRHILVLLLLISVINTDNLKIKTEDNYDVKLQYKAPKIYTSKIDSSDLQDAPPKLIINTNNVTKYLNNMTSQLDFSRYLFKANGKSIFFQVEYHLLNKKYDLDRKRQQLHFCLVSPFTDFFKQDLWGYYLQNLQSMNYTNFQVVMIDDQSEDNSTDKLLKMLKPKFPRIHRRFTLATTKQYTDMLGSQDFAIRNLCDEESMVVLVDGGDAMIGKQALNLLNAYYQEKPDTWVVYTNYLEHQEVSKALKLVKQPISEQILKRNQYRTADLQTVIHLRSFKRAVYMKIPPQYFWRKEGLYEINAGEMWIFMACVQLAGVDRVKYLDQILYFNQPSSSCRSGLQKATNQLLRMKTPFLRLDSLMQPASETADYKYPIKYLYAYNEQLKTSRVIKCLQKLRQKIHDQNYMYPFPVPQQDEEQYNQLVRKGQQSPGKRFSRDTSQQQKGTFTMRKKQPIKGSKDLEALKEKWRSESTREKNRYKRQDQDQIDYRRQQKQEAERERAFREAMRQMQQRESKGEQQQKQQQKKKKEQSQGYWHIFIFPGVVVLVMLVVILLGRQRNQYQIVLQTKQQSKGEIGDEEEINIENMGNMGNMENMENMENMDEGENLK